jgi:hypothetical protein
MLAPLRLSASLRKTRSPVLQNLLAPDARWAIGRPARKTSGLVAADTNGTPLIQGESALPAFISGLRRSAYHVATGHRIRTGMLNLNL